MSEAGGDQTTTELAHADDAPPDGSQRGRRLATAGLAVNWAYQLLLAVVGFWSLYDGGIEILLAWCLLGTLYALVAMLVLGHLSKKPENRTPRRRVKGIRALSVVVELFTAIPAFVGVSTAILMIWTRLAPETLPAFGVRPMDSWLGVWAMLLGWGFLHWGYAQIYALQDARAFPDRALEFPGDVPNPGLIDYVYVSFTVGTTFAASDVSFLNMRTRWLVTVHSVLSFGLNALTVALAFNTIMGV